MANENFVLILEPHLPSFFLIKKSYPEDLEAFRFKAENTFYDYRDPVTGQLSIPPPVQEAIAVLEKVRRRRRYAVNLGSEYIWRISTRFFRSYSQHQYVSLNYLQRKAEDELTVRPMCLLVVEAMSPSSLRLFPHRNA